MTLTRRTVLRSASSFAAAALLRVPACGEPLPQRAEGEMEIHHIDTGRGNCTLIVCGDGTSIMVDAGAGNAAPETSAAARPDSAHRTGEYLARYAAAHVPHGKLDYFVATHIHPDHIGDVAAGTAASAAPVQLTGVSDVDVILPIDTVIDRDFPDYADAPAPTAPFAVNYRRFLDERVRGGRSVQKARVGATDQIVLRHARSADTTMQVRVLAANGHWWNGGKVIAGGNENLNSIALRIDQGRFSYYTGGDLTCATNDGTHADLDIETPVARACGRVEVAACNHHGYFDAVGPNFLRALDAQVYVLQTWDVGHPGPAQMERLTAGWTGHTADVFATGLTQGNKIFNRRFVPLLKSTQGHVVVRVSPDGATYRMDVLDSSREDGGVLASFGPYRSRA